MEWELSDRSRGSELYISKLIVEFPEFLHYLQQNDLTFSDTTAVMWEACQMATAGSDSRTWFASDEVKRRLEPSIRNGCVSHLHHWLEVDRGSFTKHLDELRRCRWMRSIRAIHESLSKRLDSGDPYSTASWLREVAGKLERSIHEAPQPPGSGGHQGNGLREAQQPNQEASGHDRGPDVQFSDTIAHRTPQTV